jgi:DUF1680 family protein
LRSPDSRITSGFWEYWQEVNANAAVFHQWEELEKSGCIDNFRILAEKKEAFRTGWFFADSDAYKWLEAASLILASQPDAHLALLINSFIELLKKAQDPDGYLFTYNQILFPGRRWVNLKIEHELYCHGHLIEAGVSHFNAFGDSDLFRITCMAADRIVEDFAGKGSAFTPGHEEIEIALFRLYEVTDQKKYLGIAEQFLEMRGRQPFFSLSLLHQSRNSNKRSQYVKSQEAIYRNLHPEQPVHVLPPDNVAKKPANARLRWAISALSGKLMQQHQPVGKQFEPVGHSVRFAYLKTACAKADMVTGEAKYRQSLEKSWQHMVEKRMYITGGIGSLPEIEGFGRDYELDPEFAYAETCAALGSLFWNREMAHLTGKACYGDLFEWQLYNAALVGMGVDGKTYIYNNPLASHGEIERRPWYAVPCCPSNLSRTLVTLQQDILSFGQDTIFIHQYISSQHDFDACEGKVAVEIISALPFHGQVKIKIHNQSGKSFKLNLRQPSWSSGMKIFINERLVNEVKPCTPHHLDPQKAAWLEISSDIHDNNEINLEFDLPIQLYYTHPKVKSAKRKTAVIRGPLVYCLESIDNSSTDIFSTVLDAKSLRIEQSTDLMGGMFQIKALSTSGQHLTFIPYFLWGNRGKSEMTVFVNVTEAWK